VTWLGVGPPEVIAVRSFAVRTGGESAAPVGHLTVKRVQSSWAPPGRSMATRTTVRDCSL
jgi:hypothetical protein